MPRKPARKPAKELISYVVVCMAYIAQAFELALDLDEQLEDTDDHEILLDQVDCAGRHLADVLWWLHPEWRDMDRRATESKALALFRKHRPDIDETLRGVQAAIDLLNNALDEALNGATAARWHGPKRRYRDIAAEFDFVADHLENALYLLDPESFRADTDALTPAQRVKLASRLEVIELEIEENREFLRLRREDAPYS